MLKCFAEADGKLLWTVSHEKLRNPAEDDGTIGLTSTPCVAGDRVFYVSNRGELVCRAVQDGKEVWSLDMRATLGVMPQAVLQIPARRGHHSFSGSLAPHEDITVSRPGEFHPEPLLEPYVNLSAHTAPAMEPSRTPSCQCAHNFGSRLEIRATQ